MIGMHLASSYYHFRPPAFLLRLPFPFFGVTIFLGEGIGDGVGDGVGEGMGDGDGTGEGFTLPPPVVVESVGEVSGPPPN